MSYWSVRLIDLATVLFALAGLVALLACIFKKPAWRQTAAFSLTLLGPLTLGLCWAALLEVRAVETLFWSRLMAGDASHIFSLGSLGLIIGSGLGLAVLSMGSRLFLVVCGVFFLFCAWGIVFLHPTPYYVPIPAWLDKTVWFLLLVGGGIGCVVVHLRFRDRTSFLAIPLATAACIFSFLSLAGPVARSAAWRSLDLAALSPKDRLGAAGCLACHTLGGVGHPDPGGGLESAASLPEDFLRAFLENPDAETARKLGIRQSPTGEMAGVQLTSLQVDALVDGFKELVGIKPPTLFGPDSDAIRAIFEAKTCLACHSLHGEGAPRGGIGGPLEQASQRDEATLRAWLASPTAENARRLQIRQSPRGAMAAFKLTEEEVDLLVPWLLSLVRDRAGTVRRHR